MHYPDTYLSVELTDFCNCSCIMCSQSVNQVIHGDSKGFMSMSMMEKVFDDLLESGCKIHKLLPFGLGEPLLHPDFSDVLHLLKRYKDAGLFNQIDLHTNAQLLDESMRKAILESWVFDTISFSMDAINPETYRKIRRHGGFESTMDNVKSFILKRNGLRPRCIIQFIVMELNASECIEFINHWSQFYHLSGKTFQINFDWWPEMLSDTIFIKTLNPICRKDVSRAIELHRNIMKTYGIEIPEVNMTPSDRRICSGPFKFISIAWDGTVTVCCIDTERALAVGNVKEHSITEIWNNVQVNQIRKGLIDGDYSSCERCRSCAGMDSPVLTRSDIMYYEAMKDGFME